MGGELERERREEKEGLKWVSGIRVQAALRVIFVDFGAPALMGRNYVILEPVASVSPLPNGTFLLSPIIFHQGCNIYRKCLAILTNTLHGHPWLK